MHLLSLVLKQFLSLSFFIFIITQSLFLLQFFCFLFELIPPSFFGEESSPQNEEHESEAAITLCSQWHVKQEKFSVASLTTCSVRISVVLFHPRQFLPASETCPLHECRIIVTELSSLRHTGSCTTIFSFFSLSGESFAPDLLWCHRAGELMSWPLHPNPKLNLKSLQQMFATLCCKTHKHWSPECPNTHTDTETGPRCCF